MKLLFDSYRILVFWWTRLPTTSSVTVVLYLLSNYGTKQRDYFFQTKVVGDSRSIATENFCPGETFCGQLPEKHSTNYQKKQLKNEANKLPFFNGSCWRLSFDSYRKMLSWWCFFADNYQKNNLRPVVQFVEWNTKAAIFTTEGCLWFKTIVR